MEGANQACSYNLIRVDDFTLDRLARPVVLQHLAQVARLEQLHPLSGIVVVILHHSALQQCFHRCQMVTVAANATKL